MKTLFFILFSFFVNQFLYSQKNIRKSDSKTEKNITYNKVRYTISASANALMCPFLSPQLMEKLTTSGADSIFKDDKLILHFITSKEKELVDIEINKMIEAVGYQSRNFKIVRNYEK